MGLTCWKIAVLATECCVFGDFLSMLILILVDGGARAWDRFLAIFIWLDPMQRDIVASDFGFDFVADSQFVWWGSWCLTSVSFHVAIPNRFAAIDYKR